MRKCFYMVEEILHPVGNLTVSLHIFEIKLFTYHTEQLTNLGTTFLRIICMRYSVFITNLPRTASCTPETEENTNIKNTNSTQTPSVSQNLFRYTYPTWLIMIYSESTTIF